MSQRRKRSGSSSQAPNTTQDQEAAIKAAADEAARNASKGMTTAYLRTFSFFMLAAAVILFLIIQFTRDDTSFPGTNSAEAGFARDMKTHHAQAVEMASIVRDRLSGSETPLHFFLTDMIQTQINQMGQMEAWLNIWGVPQGSADPPMAWMGHEVTGRMPGMASNEEIAELRTLPENEMVVRFMELMIVHHQSAVDMSNAIIERSDNEVVLRVAEAIVRTQQAEIDRMNLFIEEYGGTPGGSPGAAPGASPVASPEHDH